MRQLLASIGTALVAALALSACGMYPASGAAATAPPAGEDPQALCVGAPILGGAIGARGSRLALVDDLDSISVWSLPQRRLLRRVHAGHSAPLNTGAHHTLAFSDDGTLLANGGRDGNVRVWRLRDGRLLALLPHSPDSATRTLRTGHTTRFANAFPVHAVHFDPGGRWLASASADGSVIVWSRPDWVPRDTLWALDSAYRGRSGLRDAVLTDGGRTLLAATYDGSIHLWSTERWQGLGRLERVLPALATLAASGDGARVAAGGQLGDLRLWSRATGVLSETERAPRPGPTPRFAFSPDGATLAVAWGPGGSVLLRSPNGAADQRLALPQAAVVALLGFTPNGRTLITAQRRDRRIYFWPLDGVPAWDRARPVPSSPDECVPGSTELAG